MMKDLESVTGLSRIIGQSGELGKGPTLLVIAGVHGNETAGVKALEQLFREIRERKLQLRGSLHALRGNLQALVQGKRYLEEDLNRIWSRDSAINGQAGRIMVAEQQEKAELEQLIEGLLNATPPVYIVDLHTTSAPTRPFLVIDDTLYNRKFVKDFNLPVILGLDEFLPGTLLSHYRSRGFVSVGMEAGQHQDPNSVQICLAFLWLLLERADLISLDPHTRIIAENRIRKSVQGARGVYDVWYREKVRNPGNFELIPGLSSFQFLPRETFLGFNASYPMILDKPSRIFMPRYQSQGDDAYFLMRRIPSLAIALSAWARKKGLGRCISLLPGVRKLNGDPLTYRVPEFLVNFLGRQLLHFLGYRLYVSDEAGYRLEFRDGQETQQYETTGWYKKRRPSASL